MDCRGYCLQVFHRGASLTCKDSLFQLNATITEQTNYGQRNVALLEVQTEGLAVIDDNVKSIKDTSRLLEGPFKDILASLVSKVDHSTAQSEDIHVLLRAILDQVSGVSAQVAYVDRNSHRESRTCLSPTTNSLNDADEPGKNHELLNSLERLAELVKQKQETKYDAEAHSIIDDIDVLLQLVSAQLSEESNGTHTSKKRPVEVDEEVTLSSRELKRVRGLLTSSNSMMVNGKRT